MNEIIFKTPTNQKEYKEYEADFSNDLKHHEKMYGQQEQEELKASYKQSLANKKERDKK